MAYEHRSGLPRSYSRYPAFPGWDSVLFREGQYGQAAELVEAQEILHNKIQSIGNLIARDGDRIEGCDIIIDADAHTVQLTAGRLYVEGRDLPIGAATLAAVPMTGSVQIGVRLVERWDTEQDEPALYGLEPGSEAEGEAGAARGVVSLSWGFSGDGVAGNLYAVYLLKDGVAIDQTPPPDLTGINAQLAVYDFDANGNYVVSGCRVTALGKDGADQVFSIEAGVANIAGFKRTRQAALRHRQPESSDLMRIPTEVHTFGANPTTITLNHTPIATIREVLIEKEVTETVTRGGTPAGMDNLANTGVTAIVEVKQGGTTFVPTTDYLKSGDKIDWSPGGAEPSTGSTYTVKYRFLGVVIPSAQTSTTLTVAGGVNGGQIQVDYDFHLPRTDILGLDAHGLPVYLKGISNRANPLPPLVPANVLALAMLENNWGGKPTVTNIGVPAMTMEDNYRLKLRLIDALDLIALERLQRDIDSREPTAKNGVFVDPFTSDRYRDAGVAQTAALFDGLIRLAIDPTFRPLTLPGVTLLNWTEAVAVEQPLATRCSKINPYQNFEPMPARMSLTPAFDFWTETATEWTSDSTQEIAVPVQVRTSGSNGTTTTTTTRQTATTTMVDNREEMIDLLRQIPVNYAIKGFGAGEVLQKLTFDDIDITPAGPAKVANGSGEITGTFAIPAGVPAGSKAVMATGAGGYVTGFATLFLVRMLVGVGEAALSPAAYSMLADYFPPEGRGRAMSIYTSGVYIGSAMAFIVGGVVIQAASQAGQVAIPLLGVFKPWQAAFIYVALPGIPALILIATVREPIRRGLAALKDGRAALPRSDPAEPAPSLAYVLRHPGVYVPLLLAPGVTAMVTFGITAWLPATFIRQWGWTPGEIGPAYGLIILTCGIGGMLISGFLADWLTRSGRLVGSVVISLAATLVLIPAGLLLAFTDSPAVALAAVALTTFFLGMPVALAPPILQAVTPNQLRGQVTSVYLLLVNLIGLGCGPFLVAFFTDFVFHDEMKVGLSLGLVCALAAALGAVCLAAAIIPYRKLMASLEATAPEAA